MVTLLDIISKCDLYPIPCVIIGDIFLLCPSKDLTAPSLGV